MHNTVIERQYRARILLRLAGNLPLDDLVGLGLQGGGHLQDLLGEGVADRVFVGDHLRLGKGPSQGRTAPVGLRRVGAEGVADLAAVQLVVEARGDPSAPSLGWLLPPFLNPDKPAPAPCDQEQKQERERSVGAEVHTHPPL